MNADRGRYADTPTRQLGKTHRNFSKFSLHITYMTMHGSVLRRRREALCTRYFWGPICKISYDNLYHQSPRPRACLSRRPLRRSALGTGCTPAAVPRSTQPCISPGSLNPVQASAEVRAGILPLPVTGNTVLSHMAASGCSHC